MRRISLQPTQLDDIVHEQTIITNCRQLFAGQVVGSWPIKRNRNLHQMIIRNVSDSPFKRILILVTLGSERG